MRKVKIAPGEHYHIYNRGINKQKIFLDESDYTRFLFCLLYFQSGITFNNLGYYVFNFKKNKKFNLSADTLSKIFSTRYVELVNFCLMPNHFHLTVFEKNEKGIATYMQRVLNSYTKYFNTKYKRTGHLFQGPYQAVYIEDNEQLLHVSTYIHKNPKEVWGFNNSELISYPWSSYQDYVVNNRWDVFLKLDIVLGQFKNKVEYIDFVKTSTAKENI
jgi:putative transposase